MTDRNKEVCDHGGQYCDKCSTFIRDLLTQRDREHEEKVKKARESLAQMLSIIAIDNNDGVIEEQVLSAFDAELTRQKSV